MNKDIFNSFQLLIWSKTRNYFWCTLFLLWHRFHFFFSGTNFFLGFLTKQQNSWKWFSQHFVSSWDSCFKGKLIGRKNMYFNFRLCKNVFSDLIKRFFLRKNRRTNTVYFNFWFFSLKKRILCKQDIVLCWDFHVKLYVYIQPVIWV